MKERFRRWKSLQPRGMVLTNIFRDQLDRYGEIDSIRKAIGKGLQAAGEGSFQVINADDPSLTAIESGSRGERWYFGLELELPAEKPKTRRTISSCPRCRQKLHYDQLFLAHLGRYRCLSCGFKRPAPDVKLVGCTAHHGATALELLLRGEPLRALFPLIGTTLQCPRRRNRSRGYGCRRQRSRPAWKKPRPPSDAWSALLKGATC